ncbi:MAG: hypothetical protein GY786_21805 [Proteobacteria bacterium]|nr:hypothetical protein [Pseudomonadota bacterium]
MADPKYDARMNDSKRIFVAGFNLLTDGFSSLLGYQLRFGVILLGHFMVTVT